MNCTQLNQIKLTDLLQKLGYHTIKISQKEAWYLSPFREELMPSFKIDLGGNVWFDHGAGKGGRTVDFICNYFNCSVKEALAWAINQNFDFSFQKQENYKSLNKSYELIRQKPLRNILLINYLKSRNIYPELAQKYCKEIIFSIKDKKQFAIGFENCNGGFELRNKYLKLCIGTKDISHITNQSNQCLVFEGFIDFLSYLILNIGSNYQEDYLILNSISMISKAKIRLEKYSNIKLYLDRDDNGKRISKDILSEFKQAIDKSGKYESYKDLNDYLVNKPKIRNIGYKR